jgi:hypothetical protein
MPSYPRTLPHSVVQLIEELDEAIAPARIDGPSIDEERLRELIFEAGRRSIVDELVRLLNRSKE